MSGLQAQLRPSRRNGKRPERTALQYEHNVLVLQGGGALGAYQAGVYEGLHHHGLAPDWIAGVSIGAINAALIAGNAPGERVERLRQFWERVSSGMPIVAPAEMSVVHKALTRLSAASAVAFGVPGFFVPRVPPAFLAPDGTQGALSVYDTAPLRSTLEELVDFDRINDAEGARLSVGAVDVDTGASTYFDNRRRQLGVEHVMASGSLPPGFPPIEIDGAHYWDGGIVTNSPLWYVLEDSPEISALIVQVDLFNARGELPANLDQVLERAKDIQYSSKTLFNTSRIQELEALRHALGRLLRKLPAKLRDDADYKSLAPFAMLKRQITIAHLINRRLPDSSQAKDYEFSRATVREHWEAGREDVRRAYAHHGLRDAREVVDGVRVLDLFQ
jgi:NTE family protein